MGRVVRDGLEQMRRMSSKRARKDVKKLRERPPKANQMHVKDLSYYCKDSQFTAYGTEEVKVLTAVFERSWQGIWGYFDHSESHPQDHISD
jgi:hypothetical protein